MRTRAHSAEMHAQWAARIRFMESCFPLFVTLLAVAAAQADEPVFLNRSPVTAGAIACDSVETPFREILEQVNSRCIYCPLVLARTEYSDVRAGIKRVRRSFPPNTTCSGRSGTSIVSINWPEGLYT